MFDLLVIDDSETWQKVVMATLDGLCSCDVATIYNTAVLKIRARQYKAVCLNWKFDSSYNGLKLLTLLREQYPDVPVVLISGELEGALLRIKSQYPNVREILIKGSESEPHTESPFVLDLLDIVPRLVMGQIPCQVPTGPARVVFRERKGRTISWLHISDLHFCPPDYEADLVLQNLISDVEQQIQNEHLQPDFIVVTGDVAHTGTPKQYKRATKFFDRLLHITNLGKERLFVVPGNHDIHWKSIDRTLAAGYSTDLTTIQRIDETLDSTKHRKRILQKFRYYKQFINNYIPFRPCNEKHFFFAETVELVGKRVSVLGLNSVWMSAYKWKPGKEYEKADDRHNLILGRRQLRDALEKTQDTHLTIALMHHPTEWLQDTIDREEVEALLEKHCDFVLRGHLHDNKVLGQQTPGGKTITITAGASFQTRGNAIDYNGYNFVLLDLDTRMGIIHLRCYSNKYGGFWTADGYSYPDIPDGCFSFPLPDSLLP